MLWLLVWTCTLVQSVFIVLATNLQDASKTEKLQSSKLKKASEKSSDEAGKEQADEEAQCQVDGEIVDTMTAPRGPTNTMHTAMDYLHFSVSSLFMRRCPDQMLFTAYHKILPISVWLVILQAGELDVEELRQKMEAELQVFNKGQNLSEEEMRRAKEAWQQYEAITGSLSRELCEQLRLVLEPTQASKLRWLL